MRVVDDHTETRTEPRPRPGSDETDSSRPFTAKRHVQNMLNKLALHRRQDAATRFREEVKAGVSGAYSFVPEES